MKEPLQIVLAASNFGYLSAAVVIDTHWVFPAVDFPFPGLEHFNVGNGPTSMIVSRLGPTTFTAGSPTLGDGFNYYVLDLGFRFECDSSPVDSLLVSNYQHVPISQTQFEIPDGTSIFVGSEIIYFGPEAPGFPPVETKTYGWIALHNNGRELTSAGSATAFDLPGIIVGTTTAIPEPSTILLISLAPLVLLRRNRRSLS